MEPSLGPDQPEIVWDPEKASDNLRAHKVSFEEARTALHDPWSIAEPDAGHSDAEPRLTVWCRSPRDRVLRVTITQRGPTIRIVSARKANKRQRQAYEDG